eukprot:360840-Chlamydomonas_euryale.AAC.6
MAMVLRRGAVHMVQVSNTSKRAAMCPGLWGFVRSQGPVPWSRHTRVCGAWCSRHVRVCDALCRQVHDTA